ncbi:MAG: phage holin family protein [Verrucomicrobiales bacterium]|jgi:uncharacterized membrane protein YqjE|nr:phage holin family protein [Verrucomicrobiales bacterium]
MSEFTSGPGVFTSLKRLATNLIGMVETRGSLFVTELHEEKIRIIQALVWTVLTVVLGALGLALATLLVILALWRNPDHLLVALTVLSALYLSAAAVAACYLRKTLGGTAKPFEETLNQLRRDRECLGK